MSLPNIDVPSQFYDGDTVMSAAIAAAVAAIKPQYCTLVEFDETPSEAPDPRFAGDVLTIYGTTSSGIAVAVPSGVAGALAWDEIVDAVDA